MILIPQGARYVSPMTSICGKLLGETMSVLNHFVSAMTPAQALRTNSSVPMSSVWLRMVHNVWKTRCSIKPSGRYVGESGVKTWVPDPFEHLIETTGIDQRWSLCMSLNALDLDKNPEDFEGIFVKLSCIAKHLKKLYIIVSHFKYQENSRAQAVAKYIKKCFITITRFEPWRDPKVEIKVQIPYSNAYVKVKDLLQQEEETFGVSAPDAFENMMESLEGPGSPICCELTKGCHQEGVPCNIGRC